MGYLIRHKRFKGLTIYGLGGQLKTKKQAKKWMAYQRRRYKKEGFKYPEWKIVKI